MPLYEYDCPTCKKVFEIVQKFSDPVLTACPTCSSPVTKVFSQTSFQLKGSGWYVTDYKKPAGGGSDSSSGGSSES
jgi:putative FmdB family regulatory protein